MGSTEIGIVSFCIAVLVVYGIVICFRFLLPRDIIPNISTLLSDARQSLTSAETTGVISAMSDHRESLEALASDLARMRIESHLSPGFFPQIWLAFRFGLTYRLYSLASEIRAVKMRVEIVVDRQRLGLVATPRNVFGEAILYPPRAAHITNQGYLL